MAHSLPPVKVQKEIFAEVVRRQDRGDSIGESRAKVAEMFNVSEQAVQDIERIGLMRDWPPLN